MERYQKRHCYVTHSRLFSPHTVMPYWQDIETFQSQTMEVTMPTLKVPLDDATYEALLENASAHLRPPLWHAAAILKMALGLPIPAAVQSANAPFLSSEVLQRTRSMKDEVTV
jgi:hypothetical protein